MTTDILKRPQVAAEVSSEDRVRVVEEFTRNERVATTTACFAGRTSLLGRGCYGLCCCRSSRPCAGSPLTTLDPVLVWPCTCSYRPWSASGPSPSSLWQWP
ncbi:DUF6192 family protein [Streptomyces sp. NPDC088180]|uniref:DUF6192 family protein n=1 Tax=Streptomyces sp. NPDC088180 TaxID=3365837 RepID=UPI0038001944